jgi:UDP-N-acetylmuramoyl-tripeptide--D-alanyl-D-alanine ligase
MRVDFFENHFDSKLNIDLKNFSEVSTDTRTLKKGALFVALKGENFDGHKFVESAFERGAAAALISDETLSGYGPSVVVNDVLKSFQDLGKAWQDHVNPRVIGITGSNGKTTAKFFTAQVLKRFFKVSFSPKSYNNEIGVPFTQLMLKEDDQVLVSEIGTNAKGEIENLTKMVEPQIAVVTTVGPAHIEHFRTIDNIAIEKKEIYKSKKLEIGIFNIDNPWTKKMHEEFKGKKITFSVTDSTADVCLKADQVDLDALQIKGKVFGLDVQKDLKLFGDFNVYNIMTALCFGKALGVETEELIKSLDKIETPWGRSQVLKFGENNKCLFDGYNSNLQSMEALLKGVSSLKASGKNLHFVLGEMLELGEEGSAMHKILGSMVGEIKPSSVSFIGPSFEHFLEGLKVSGFSKKSVISKAYEESLANEIQSVLHPNDLVVVKGSRGMKLERVVRALGAELPEL